MFVRKVENINDDVTRVSTSPFRQCNGWGDFDPEFRYNKRTGCKAKRSKDKTLRTHRTGR